MLNFVHYFLDFAAMRCEGKAQSSVGFGFTHVVIFERLLFRMLRRLLRIVRYTLRIELLVQVEVATGQCW